MQARCILQLIRTQVERVLLPLAAATAPQVAHDFVRRSRPNNPHADLVLYHVVCPRVHNDQVAQKPSATAQGGRVDRLACVVAPQGRLRPAVLRMAHGPQVVAG